MASAAHLINVPSARLNNLFPKISGKYYDFLSQLKVLKDSGELPPILNLEGTVKLHGMHADIVFNIQNPDSASPNEVSVHFQSRNRVCTSDEDQHGWPREVARFPEALKRLRDQVLSTFQSHNPNTLVDLSQPLVVAGEWIGGRVQRDVGIARLTNRFVILSVQINGVWQRDADYKDIQTPEAGIYNIFVCGSHIVKFDTSDISNTNPALFELQRLADAVEVCCPFAARFGIPNSRGEGIVWKPGTPEGRGDAKHWLKTKGPIFGPENRIDPETIAADQVRNLTVADAVVRWVTPRRLEQGFEYLLELQMEPTRLSLKEYINWVVNDVLEEEKQGIAILTQKFPDIEKTIKARVGVAARDTYLEEMRKSGIKLA